MAAPTLLDVVRLSTTYLASHGSHSPRLDAELLTAHSLGLRRLDLYLQHDRPLRDEELVPVRTLLRRRGAGEPVAYLVGTREFYGRAFAVSPAVLIPRPDTETLVERVLGVVRERGTTAPRIVDIGTGSGCIAVTLAAELPEANVIATDVSEEAAAMARGNAERWGVADRVEVVVGAWWEPLGAEAPFDVVVSNPPYVTTEELDALERDVRDHEPRLALDGGADGLAAYRTLLDGAPPLVVPAAIVAVEGDPRRAAAVAALMAARWPNAAITEVPDLTGRTRVVEAALP